MEMKMNDAGDCKMRANELSRVTGQQFIDRGTAASGQKCNKFLKIIIFNLRLTASCFIDSNCP